MTATSILLSATVLSIAFQSAAAETRDLGSHEHGHGALNVAVEGNTLEIELAVPGFDIVGFEHPAEADEDKVTIAAGLEQLSTPNELFTFPSAAACQSTNVTAELHGGEHDDHHGHKDHDEHHNDEAKHENHDDHESHSEESHSEFHASYTFTCQNVSELKSVKLRYFTIFENAEELNVQIVTDAGAKKVEATAESPTIKLY